MDYIIRLSLYLTPIVLITGPALSDITITIASLAFVFKSIRKCKIDVIIQSKY